MVFFCIYGGENGLEASRIVKTKHEQQNIPSHDRRDRMGKQENKRTRGQKSKKGGKKP